VLVSSLIDLPKGETGNFRNFDFRKFSIGKNAKIVSLDLAIEQLFDAGSLRTAKARLDLLEGCARRRCFPP
jgi:hypothetical protein